jgi:hypothetical protein
MSHAALVNDGLFWLVLFMTVLLAMFVCAVVMMPPEAADRSSEESPLGPPGLPPPASVAALPSRRPPAPASPAGPVPRPGGTGYAARHTPAAAPVTFAPKAPSDPRRAPVLATILGIGGVAAAVIGGWLLFGTSHVAVACRHPGVAICSEGFVVLTGAQVLGCAMAVAGIALGFTALWLALR